MGLIGGCITTLLGTGLTMLWDLEKSDRESNQRERVIISAFKEEMIANQAIAKNNLNNLKLELKVLNETEEGKIIVPPLQTHQTGSWDLLKIYFPESFTKNPNIIVKLRTFYQTLNYLNDSLRSREEYRLNNSVHTAYQRRLRVYDDHLVEYEEFLLKQLGELEPMLSNLSS